MPAVNTLVGDNAPDFYGYNDAASAAAHLGDDAYANAVIGPPGRGGVSGAVNVHVAGIVLLGLALIIVFHKQGFRGINV